MGIKLEQKRIVKVFTHSLLGQPPSSGERGKGSVVFVRCCRGERENEQAGNKRQCAIDR